MDKKCRKFYDYLASKDPIIIGDKKSKTKDRNNPK